ncbi:MAG: 30S ribosomal protein S8 [Candidatus Moraniibacteriota bacterium]
MLDPIADMLTRIRNAQQAGLKEVVLPASKIKWSIAKILEARGFVEKTEKIATGKFPELRLVLRYVQVTPTQRDPAIRALERVSRQGQRIYVKRDQIRRVKNGFGLAIVSTPKGLMTGEEAYHSGLGGEYICRIW